MDDETAVSPRSNAATEVTYSFHVSVGSCFPTGAGSWLLLTVLLHSCERNQAILTLCRAPCISLSQFDNAVGSQLSLRKWQVVSSACRVLQEEYILG